MTATLQAHIFHRRLLFSLTFLALLLGLSLTGCSRSAWIQIDEAGVAHEVAPREQLGCAQHVQQQIKEGMLKQEVIKQRIEQCMLDKGYKRRPWWLFKDLHWHVKEPSY